MNKKIYEYDDHHGDDGDYEDDDKGKGHERTTKIEMLMMLIKRNAAVDNVTQAENTCNDASRQ